MEELRTTEVLDKEILEDARKKAFKILGTADENVKTQNGNWETKTRNAVAEIRKTYENRTRQTTEEILARGPLDKRRMRSQTSEMFLRQAMDEFLRSLKHQDMIDILEHELEKELLMCINGEISPDEKPDLVCSNLEEAEADNLIRRILAKPGFKGTSFFGKWQIKKAANALYSFPAIIINTQDLRITASVEDAAARLLEEKRAELVTSLLGEGALND